MFPSNGMIGPVYLTLMVGGNSSSIEMISDNDLTFTTSASELGLPSLLFSAPKMFGMISR